MALLDGRLTGLTHPQIVEALLTDTDDPDDPDDPDDADTGPQAGGAADAAAAAAGSVAPGADADDGAVAPDTEPAAAAAGAAEPGPDAAATALGVSAGGAAAPAPPAAAPGGPGAGDPVAGSHAAPGRGREGIEIRVGLPTLLGRDARPGELPGWGPVLPEVARRVVARQHRAEWRFAIVDHQGHLLQTGLTRRRPTGSRTDPDTRTTRGGIVELHVPAATLAEFAADPPACGRWAGVITDLAAQHTTPAGPAHRPADRFIRSGLRRHIQIRDRSCVGIGCRRPAAKSDADHTIDHATGGPTTPGNAGPLCRKDHRKKHHGGWQLTQPAPGRFRWTSPLGHIYRTRGEPPWPTLPEPLPAHPTGGGRNDRPTGTDPPPF